MPVNDDHMCGLGQSLPLYKQECVRAWKRCFFFMCQQLTCLGPMLLVMLAVPVRKSRGILSLDKHVALNAAVTSWNGSWHKVAPLAKNKLWRYTTDQGKIQGREFHESGLILLSNVLEVRDC